ncbi:unnamed protein product [Closterium sp. NIES-53]
MLPPPLAPSCSPCCQCPLPCLPSAPLSLLPLSLRLFTPSALSPVFPPQDLHSSLSAPTFLRVPFARFILDPPFSPLPVLPFFPSPFSLPLPSLPPLFTPPHPTTLGAPCSSLRAHLPMRCVSTLRPPHSPPPPLPHSPRLPTITPTPLPHTPSAPLLTPTSPAANQAASSERKRMQESSRGGRAFPLVPARSALALSGPARTVSLPCSHSHCLPPRTSRPAAACESRPAAACESRPAALPSTRYPSLQPVHHSALPLGPRAALPCSSRAALPCPAAHRPAATTAAAGGGATGSAAVAAGAGGAGPTTDRHYLSWPLSRQLQWQGVDSSGYCLSRTTPPLSNFVSGLFSEPVQVVEALRCVTGSVEAAALGASESAAELGASESAPAPGASESAATLSALSATPSWHALSSSCLWSSQVPASPAALACPALTSLRRGAAARRSSHLLVFPDNYSLADSPHGRDLPVLRLHSDRSGEFSSNLLRLFCRGEGILQSFTLPDYPQQNGIAERRIGLVMKVARTSMIHAAAPHFLWLFAVRYAAHQVNLWPRVSLPETSPTLRWTGEVGDVSVFRVWGSRAFVRDTSTDKLPPRAIPCVFLGFVPDAPGWQFYHPTSHRFFPSEDVTFDESVPFYRLFPYRSAPPTPPPLFLAPGAARGAAFGGAASGGAEPGGAESEGAETRGAEPGDVETGGSEPGGAEPEGVEPEHHHVN